VVCTLSTEQEKGSPILIKEDSRFNAHNTQSVLFIALSAISDEIVY